VQLVFFSMAATGIGFFLALWGATVVWIARDAKRRCGHSSLRIAAPLLAIAFPFAGAGFYALVKPCEERAHVRTRRLRTNVYEAILADAGERCPECAAPLQPEFRCCPVCGESVRSTCGGCDQPVRTEWVTCPWCTESLVERDEAAALSEVA
jgi:predicted nucleic acid-binding Zn ribbon protein